MSCAINCACMHAHAACMQGIRKTRNEEMGNEKWRNEEMKKWDGNGRQTLV